MICSSQQGTATGYVILVADEQPEALISTLKHEGHRVLAAGTGTQVLRLLKKYEIDLLLIDYVMPRLPAEQLIRKIRRFNPLVQIVLQTENADQRPPRSLLAELDIQGYHDKAEGPDKLLLWVDAGLKASRLVRRLDQRDRMEREFVANVSHELRTPLNVIAEYTALLLSEDFGPLSSDVAAVLRRIETASINLQELGEDFLRYAQIDAGIRTVTETEIRTQDLAVELQRVGTLLADEKDLFFSVDTQDAPSRFVADSVKIRTILRNFLINAVKFTEQGGVMVRIALEDDGLRFAVRDTGPGIQAGDLEVIFEPFRQLNSSAARRYPGIGLGLALCRKLAVLVGGNIEVSSEPGVGSTFTLVLPASAAHREETPPRAQRLREVTTRELRSPPAVCG